MSIALLNAAFAAPGLTAPEKMVLVVLANEVRDRHVDLCWPCMESIATKASMTVRGVRGVIRRLEATGLIQIAVKGGRGLSNRYRILLDQSRDTAPGFEAESPEPDAGSAIGTRTLMPGLARLNPERGAGLILETRKETALNPEPRAGEPLEPLEDRWWWS
ncbi:MAG: hypothetical protein ACJAVS_001115 [Paracoccaceae bacterium]|jgi:hypothetical protein